MSNKHRMLIITDTYVGMPGGSERHLYNFFRGASGQFEIDAYQLLPERNPMLNDGPFPGKDNIRLHSRPLNRFYGMRGFALFTELIYLVVIRRISIVVSYHEKADIFNFLLKCLFRRRLICISSKRDMGFKLSGRLKEIMQRITPKFDALTCPSASIRDLLIAEYQADPANVFVIKNGVELEKYTAISPAEKTSLRGKLGLPAGGRILSIVGCLKPVKGHTYLIEGFRQFLSSTDQAWNLVILGEGELQASLQEQVKAAAIQDKVIFTGYQSNVHEWLKVTDVVISASLSEGLSNALIEACAAGCPVIATDVGGNPEIVSQGVNGILVTAQNPQQICRALLSLDAERINNMGQNAREKAFKEFSNTAMVENLESFYSNCANAH